MSIPECPDLNVQTLMSRPECQELNLQTWIYRPEYPDLNVLIWMFRPEWPDWMSWPECPDLNVLIWMSLSEGPYLKVQTRLNVLIWRFRPEWPDWMSRPECLKSRPDFGNEYSWFMKKVLNLNFRLKNSLQTILWISIWTCCNAWVLLKCDKIGFRTIYVRTDGFLLTSRKKRKNL